jgi:methionyl-tRNA formyltransferase
VSATDAHPKANMLRVVFFGMELQILDELRKCPVHLLGAHLPSAPYQLLSTLPPFLKSAYKFLFRKRHRTASIFMPLKNFLTTHHIPALSGTDINTPKFKRVLERMTPDLGVVANFGQIFRTDLISIPKYGLINYHPSLLPRYRGPAPWGHILLNREKISGVTWHCVTPAVDQGDILAQMSFAVSAQDTIKDLEKTSVKLAIEMLSPLITSIAQNKINPIAQDESMASYYPKLTKPEKVTLSAMGKLD